MVTQGLKVPSHSGPACMLFVVVKIVSLGLNMIGDRKDSPLCVAVIIESMLEVWERGKFTDILALRLEMER